MRPVVVGRRKSAWLGADAIDQEDDRWSDDAGADLNKPLRRKREKRFGVTASPGSQQPALTVTTSRAADTRVQCK